MCVEAQPVEAQPVEAQPVEAQPAEARRSEQRAPQHRAPAGHRSTPKTLAPGNSKARLLSALRGYRAAKAADHAAH